MAHGFDRTADEHGLTMNPAGSSSVVLVCEHAANDIPQSFHGLGLSQADRISHAAWDPGALAVAMGVARHLDATLVAGRVSRLVYDCNRPPSAVDAMPARSETIEVPGNRNLRQEDRAARVNAYYLPFRDAVCHAVDRVFAPVIVTVHSFTPVYYGRPRSVEIGILHDSDTRLADAMLDMAATHTTARVKRNKPYGPEDGVTHTLKEHAIAFGYPNVMIEIRNDLIATDGEQQGMALCLSQWLVDALTGLRVAGSLNCQP